MLAIIFTVLASLLTTLSLPLPGPTGKYAVGYTQHVFNHTTLNSLIAPNGTTGNFLVTFFYPSSQTPNATIYLDPTLASILESYYSFSPDSLATITAPMQFQSLTLNGTASESIYPTLIFLPGLGLPVRIYTTLLIDLASQGYVVAGIDHPYEAPWLQYPYGGPGMPGLPLSETNPTVTLSQSVIERLLEIRVSDAKAVLDSYPTLVAEFGAPFNVSSYGFLGHGIGGVAAIQAMEKASANASISVVGAVDIDGLGNLENLDKRVFYLWDEELGRAGQRVENGNFYVVPGSGYMDFSDMTTWKGIGADIELEDVGSINGMAMANLTRTFVEGFFYDQIFV